MGSASRRRTTPRRATHRAAHSSTHPWAVAPREDLLDVRLCDLGITIDGTWLEECVGRLLEELDRHGLRFKPHFWLSDEWFCPHGIPGIAIPFYLPHPRLMRLEHNEMREVEGGTKRQCLQLLRHETGHAILYAHGLHRRRRWQELYGRSSKPYPEAYRPDPTSRAYVQHLDYWYAQSHPLEDFAETFAVWLDPRSAWRRRYARWPRALAKLEYLDELMENLAGLKPPRPDRRRIDEVSSNRMTLREHYRRRRDRYGSSFSAHFDAELRRLFADSGPGTRRAAGFLSRNGGRLRRRLHLVLPEDDYSVSLVLRELIGRCRELSLRTRPRDSLFEDCALLLSICVSRRLHAIRDWYAM